MRKGIKCKVCKEIIKDNKFITGRVGQYWHQSCYVRTSIDTAFAR